jgi:ribosomal protein L7Ae-like RNA K-turn-binding protein
LAERDESMTDATWRRLLGLVGLGVRGRLVVVGVEQVRDAARRGTLLLAIVAPDASRHSLDKVVPLLRARRLTIVEGLSASELGAAVGRETTAAVGVLDPGLERGIRKLMEEGATGALGSSSVEASSGDSGERHRRKV